MADIKESIRVGLHLKKKSNLELANGVGVSTSTVSLWRNGKRRIHWEQIVKIAEFFGVSVSILVGWGERND